MSSYLLTWNPKRWDWDDLLEYIKKLKRAGFVTSRWSCGNSKRIQVGDRVYLIRLGKLPKGIFASGIVIKDSYEGVHWDEEKAASGKKAKFVEVQWDILLNPESELIISLEQLKNEKPFSTFKWETQSSGINIPDEIANALEQMLNIKSARTFRLPEEVLATDKFVEGSIKQILVNAYERNAEARKKCIAHYGFGCSVCGFNFGKIYGEAGKVFINVHHLKPLSEIGKKYKV